MGRFRGTVQGNRGEASRLGSISSGLEVTASGWDIGVNIHIDVVDGKDVIKIYKTDGSNGYSSELIHTLKEA